MKEGNGNHITHFLVEWLRHKQERRLAIERHDKESPGHYGSMRPSDLSPSQRPFVEQKRCQPTGGAQKQRSKGRSVAAM